MTDGPFKPSPQDVANAAISIDLQRRMDTHDQMAGQYLGDTIYTLQEGIIAVGKPSLLPTNLSFGGLPLFNVTLTRTRENPQGGAPLIDSIELTAPKVLRLADWVAYGLGWRSDERFLKTLTVTMGILASVRQAVGGDSSDSAAPQN